MNNACLFPTNRWPLVFKTLINDLSKINCYEAKKPLTVKNIYADEIEKWIEEEVNDATLAYKTRTNYIIIFDS